MNVPGYREDASAVPADQNRDGHSLLVDGDNNIIPIETNSRHRRQGRPESISSIGSEDSVDLQDLINANFTVDMDDETNLTDLAELGLEDSEDFLKTYEVSSKENKGVNV
ncbi:hypothetical protein PHYBLDRAFT_159129 [Phycomyces blakesleeanus NRRL 1555(-)]|uniref:Uncharacterized protein n=1 Tax=Phycomyces blakesleeanus (strain ATCC 8743b / DSM 1359 / FGSC 10004 / NBRC 33097 / NRRL 1555) TaxID=763407 RepID=A0A162TZV0_PHYB8|nr:hypothetical protein PHYBLDRAFT_159129 [Phycomyces blakesleeanus NRRL 1555(-)]OAD72342.1 hypothetical protein PHYBLDRAFT_159129 [Phycomyces blakesleeanus NRRL 1555(-)]|eukprot:XP_018290382.1 hypothetical protein PHYBLDRAFT_159129 [Phycomyces blakesleeanus NRRL 1555(-)]